MILDERYSIAMDRLDIDKKRAIELGVRYVDDYWKSVIENEINVSILRYILTQPKFIQRSDF